MRVLRPFLYFLFFIFVFVFFSYKLTDVPPGINIDEASIGYNAGLISKSYHDENGRLLPVFILTLDGKDWKNPVNVYSTALVFKILGKSYFNLRLVSVIYAIVSAFIFLKLLRLFFPEKLSFLGLLLFLSSPSLLLQGHLASDNISSLPLFLLWLYFFFSYLLKPRGWKLILSGIFLGIAFYSYKGMRAMVPVYLMLSLAYLFYYQFLKMKNIKPVLLFLAGVIPFLVPINWLQTYYAGAIYDPRIVSRPSFYDAAYTYFSSFDFSFLFVKGDQMLVHSTGRHGMFLIPTLLLFFLGLFEIVEEKNKHYYFLLAVLLFTPLLLVSVGSVYRASRLITYIPIATFIFTLGIKRIVEIKPVFYRSLILVFLTTTIFLSYVDFVRYYWNDYPKTVQQDFTSNLNEGLENLWQISLKENKTAYIERNLFISHKAGLQFFWEVYFPDKNLKTWFREKETFPQNGVVLTTISSDGEIKNYQEIPDRTSGRQIFFVVGK